MSYFGESFQYRNHVLYCEDVELAKVAEEFGTPCYVYSSQGIRSRYHAYDRAFGSTPHVIHYAVKANSNLSVLRLLAVENAGFDIVSGGELFRVLRAGGDAAKVVFSGVGKTAAEIEFALQNNVGCFNCESETELALLDAIASRLGVTARAAMRVNPDVDAGTHPYISTGLRDHKFGIDMGEAEQVYRRAAGLRSVRMEAVSCHIGSQLLDTAPMLEAVDRMLGLVTRLRELGAPVSRLDFGGGLGVAYAEADSMPSIRDFIGEVCRRMLAAFPANPPLLEIEPGRSIVGDAGVLITRVLYRKKTERKEFVVVDAGMNDLIRPALYQSHHEIVPLRHLAPAGTVVADVVGPVCESGDFLARGRHMANVFPGDLLAVCTAGAYGFALSSNYNARPRAAEVLVDGGGFRLARRRETLEDLVRGEEE